MIPSTRTTSTPQRRWPGVPSPGSGGPPIFPVRLPACRSSPPTGERPRDPPCVEVCPTRGFHPPSPGKPAAEDPPASRSCAVRGAMCPETREGLSTTRCNRLRQRRRQKRAKAQVVGVSAAWTHLRSLTGPTVTARFIEAVRLIHQSITVGTDRTNEFAPANKKEPRRMNRALLLSAQDVVGRWALRSGVGGGSTGCRMRVIRPSPARESPRCCRSASRSEGRH